MALLVMQISIFSLPSLLMQVCLVVKVEEEVEVEPVVALVLQPLQVFLPSNPVWVMVLVVLVRLVPAGMVRLEVQAATAATAVEQQGFV
jgi:hypothetical protein